MSDTYYITRARVVLPDETRDDASVLVRDGRIESIAPQSTPSNAREIPLRGAYLIPGLVDPHTDVIERELEPRTGVVFPLPFVLRHLDRVLASVGVTTCFHAPSFVGEEMGLRENAAADRLCREICAHRNDTLVDHRIHCRYEITEPEALDMIVQLINDGMCDLVSLMDHSPGQGQFAKAGSYRDYLVGNYGMSDDKVNTLLERKAEAGKGSLERMRALAQHASERGIPLASHDDDTLERVELVASLGVQISEFPLSMEVAEEVTRRELAVLVGSPNVVRGRSQSGHLRAADLIGKRVANCLCSDYLPPTLLPAVLRLHRELEMPLHEAVRLATLNPATAVRLDDRGSIAPGKRADLVAVVERGDSAIVTHTWTAGRLILEMAHT